MWSEKQTGKKPKATPPKKNLTSFLGRQIYLFKIEISFHVVHIIVIIRNCCIY